MIPLSVLDQSPIAEGMTATQALYNSLDLAARCDELGYGRYWVAEHHASVGLAGCAPEALIGPLTTPSDPRRVTAPGMLESHYAPRARVLLDVTTPPPGAAYLAFGAPAPAGGLTLSATGDLVEAAANLYAHLRALDASGAETIAVAPVPAHGLGEAIADRLRRAAAPRT